MKRKIEEFDIVVLRKDIKKLGLMAGDTGTVVEILGSGEAFFVEFSTGSVYNSAVEIVKRKDVRLIKDDEILHTRPVSMDQFSRAFA